MFSLNSCTFPLLQDLTKKLRNMALSKSTEWAMPHSEQATANENQGRIATAKENNTKSNRNQLEENSTNTGWKIHSTRKN